MKKPLLFLMAFFFTFVSIGALDCGCAFASLIEVSTPQSVSKASENPHCHMPEEKQSKQNKKVCCSGCQLETKAPIPQSVQVYSPHQNEFFDFNLSLSQSIESGVISLLETSQRNTENASLPTAHSRSVPFYNTPIYIAVRSFLI